MFFKKYGLGNSTTKNFQQIFGVNLSAKQLFLKTKTKTAFAKENINKLTDMDLIRKIRGNIAFFSKIKSLRGFRHRKQYPVRGQRTHTNATPKKFKKNYFSEKL